MILPEPAAPFVATIRESNRQGEDAWSRYADHRRRLTCLLASVAQSGSSLRVLGAGNLNDLDLQSLLSVYSEIHLVDIDEAAVRAALGRQGVTNAKSMHVHAPVDLTGILHLLPTAGQEWRPSDTDELIATMDRLHRPVPAPAFDVSISSCTLTQLLQSVVESSLPPIDRTRVSLALRDKHLHDLVYLTRPGGCVILVSDVVSTTTAQWLDEVPEDDLEEHMARLIASANFFTGTNPYRVVAILEEDPRFRQQVAEVRLLDPWLWQVTPDRRHLVYAIVAQRYVGVG